MLLSWGRYVSVYINLQINIAKHNLPLTSVHCLAELMEVIMTPNMK